MRCCISDGAEESGSDGCIPICTMSLRRQVEASDDRLPTASTCFNILKLPAYSSEKVLKARLLASIHSGAGFDLS